MLSPWLSIRFIALLASTSAMLSGCATDPPAPPPGPPPNVRLGPVLELLPSRTSDDRVVTLVDRDGRAHVIVAATKTHEVHHLIVSRDGLVSRERVASNTSPSTLSAATDATGKLHLLIDRRHLERAAGEWTQSSPTPWETHGIEAHASRFVKGAHGLVWAFTAEGQAVDARGRWDWYGFGGYGAGIIFPWHSASRKLVVVSEIAGSDPCWHVLDPQDNLDAVNATTAVDGTGSLHVVYEASSAGMAASAQLRYARTSLIGPPPPAAPEEPTGNRKLCPFRGDQIPWFATERAGAFQAASATDPSSGMVLVVRTGGESFAVRENKWTYPVTLPVPRFWWPKLAPAGSDAFHLIARGDGSVWYALYARGAWTGPVTLGTAGTAFGALDLAGAADGRAFAVWPTDTAIVGRWIERTDGLDERRTPTPDATPDTLPEHLRDFAKGEAQLITPGVATGFAAALAAGANTPLTKRLHDSEQWDTLAAVVLKDNYGDDLRWYYLGRAAEGMALCDAAERYYRISRERSESFWTRCLGVACAGLELPGVLEPRMKTLTQLRAEGRCTAAMAPPPRR